MAFKGKETAEHFSDASRIFTVNNKEKRSNLEPEVQSDGGDNVQSDEYGDNPVYSKMLHSKHERVIMNRGISGKVRISAYSEPDVNSMETLEMPFVYHDYVDKKGERIFKNKDINAHDKMAFQKTQTNTGGGARFEYTYSDKGKLKAEIELFRGKEQTDNKGFRNRSVRFANDTINAFEDIAPDNNEAAASSVDSKAEILLVHATDRVLEKKRRLECIEKESHTEQKHLKKEIQKHSFKSSQTQFKDKEGEFTDLVESRFKKRGQDAAGNSVFVDIPTVETANQIMYEEKTVKKENVETTQQSVINEAGRGEKTNTLNMDGERKEDTTGNRHSRSVDSYFTAGDTNPYGTDKNAKSRFLTREEKLEQSQSKEKIVKKEKNKEIQKAAAMTAVSKLFSAKKNIQNQLGDMSGQGTGDLIKDGSSGLLRTFLDGAKQIAANSVKAVGQMLWKYTASAFGTLIVPVSFFLIICMLLTSSITAIGGVLSDSDAGETYDLDVSGDGYLYTNLSDSEIEDIINSLYANYPDMTIVQETALRYALSKVGCAYNQAYHGNLSVDIFDCSSLAYRAYRQAGIDISNGGTYTAAGECCEMCQKDKVVSGEMLPGDLIFYGGSNNGRYLGVYHVAIYVGRINGIDKMVEARGVSWGVVYGDVRTDKVVKIGRPY